MRPLVFMSFLGMGFGLLAGPAVLRGEDSRVYWNGTMRSRAIYSDIRRSQLGVDSFGNIGSFGLEVDQLQSAIDVDADLRLENTIDETTILDFTLKSRSQFFDPADLQGGRYRTVDVESHVTWGHELAPDTIVRLDALGMSFSTQIAVRQPAQLVVGEQEEFGCRFPITGARSFRQIRNCRFWRHGRTAFSRKVVAAVCSYQLSRRDRPGSSRIAELLLSSNAMRHVTPSNCANSYIRPAATSSTRHM